MLENHNVTGAAKAAYVSNYKKVLLIIVLLLVLKFKKFKSFSVFYLQLESAFLLVDQIYNDSSSLNANEDRSLVKGFLSLKRNSLLVFEVHCMLVG